MKNNVKKKLIFLFLLILIVPTVSAYQNSELSRGGFADFHTNSSGKIIGITSQPVFVDSKTLYIGWYYQIPIGVEVTTGGGGRADGHLIEEPEEEILTIETIVKKVPSFVWLILIICGILSYIYYSQEENREKMKRRLRKVKEKSKEYAENPELAKIETKETLTNKEVREEIIRKGKEKLEKIKDSI